MTTEVMNRSNNDAAQIERVLIAGDLAQLKPEERVSFYKMVCESVGLNPLTKPFEYITLNGKLTLYARKDCTDQLRNIHNISVTISAREVVDDCYVVTARATNPKGRMDESIGAVSLGNLKGDPKCNAMMKAETKAKRRVTLSVCGLGMLDETEIETIPSAKPPVQVTTEPIDIGGPALSSGADDTRASKDTAPKTAEPSRTDPAIIAKLEDITEKYIGPVEYISTGQQRNFHKECRAAVPPKHSLNADDLIYKWLGDNGYRDKDGLPTAALIPAGGWIATRNKAIEWLKKQ